MGKGEKSYRYRSISIIHDYVWGQEQIMIEECWAVTGPREIYTRPRKWITLHPIYYILIAILIYLKIIFII